MALKTLAGEEKLLVPDVTIRTNIDQVMARLDDVSRRQFPFAFSLALNRSMEEARDAVRQRVHQRGFTIRSAQTGAWLDQHVIIPEGKRSTKSMLRVQMRISPPGLKSGRYSAMPWINTGGVRQGSRPIGRGGLFDRAIPIPVRDSPMDIIPKKFYPAYAGLAPLRDASGGWIYAGRGKHSRRKVKANVQHLSLRGSDHVFALVNRAKGPGAGTIFRRFGQGRFGIVPLFIIRPKVSVRGRDYLMPTARRVFRDRLAANTIGFLTHALRTAK